MNKINAILLYLFIFPHVFFASDSESNKSRGTSLPRIHTAHKGLNVILLRKLEFQEGELHKKKQTINTLRYNIQRLHRDLKKKDSIIKDCNLWLKSENKKYQENLAKLQAENRGLIELIAQLSENDTNPIPCKGQNNIHQ